MDVADSNRAARSTPTLSQSGENLVLVNPEFFVQEERLRTKVKASQEAPSHRLETMVSLQRFTSFNEMPLELRRMVWKLAAKQPRVVEFSYYPKQKTTASKFPSKTLVPAILHTTREARGCGLEVYEKLEFGSCFDSTYINWHLDTVTFETIQGLKVFLNIRDNIYSSSNSLTLSAGPRFGGQSSRHPGRPRSFINSKCRRLAIKSGISCVDLSSSDISKMKTHFPLLDEFILARCIHQLGESKQGNIIIAEKSAQPLARFHKRPVENFYEEYDDDDQDLLRKVMSSHDGIEKGSILFATRDNRKLMTAVEKRERQKVKEGKMELQGAQALKEKREAAKKTAGEKKKEKQEALRQKQFEQDLILAAT
jgi:hypothetical protein